ncbi:MAG: cytochrome b6 [Coriobacteriia bacterium]|nr:cytochrome b6 [Coriobacteriia bacterium]
MAPGRFDLANRLQTRVWSRPVPMHARRFWYCFGGLAFFAAALQALSGMFLTMYYQPTVERAYASVFYISNFVKYGWLIRSIHVWGAEVMIAFVIVHMIRVYITASYKHPRELNWVAGVLLLAVTLAFGVTGFLLPWDQKAYWGSTVTMSLIREVPLVGAWIARLVVGGDTIGAATLTRFYSAHVMLLPATLTGLLLAHFWMIRKQGISGPL